MLLLCTMVCGGFVKGKGGFALICSNSGSVCFLVIADKSEAILGFICKESQLTLAFSIKRAGCR